MKPDGVFLSNGPGDPEPCDYTIDSIRLIVNQGVQAFGICLRSSTAQQHLGKDGQDEIRPSRREITPVLDTDTGQCDHQPESGSEADAKTLPPNVRVTHVSLFDGSLGGIA
jgi:carbamoyl-phosphate synthase small subunit